MYQPEELKNRYKGISSTSLNWFRLSPRYFRDKLDGKIEEPEVDYFELGTKLHYYLLEPQKFNDLYVYLNFPIPPNPKQKEFCKALANTSKVESNELQTAKDIYKSLYSTDKKSDAKITTEVNKLIKTYRVYINYLKNAETYKDTINYITNKFLEDAKNSVAIHKKASELLLSLTYSTSNANISEEYVEVNEARIYWEHPEILVNGEPIVCKSKIDRLIIDHKNKIVKLIDLKTTYSMNNFSTKFEEFKYNEQLAFYWMAIWYMFSKLFPDRKLSDYTKETYIVAISTNPSDSRILIPVETKVFKIQEKWLTAGYRNVEQTLRDMVWYLETDQWDHSREYYESDGTEII